MLKTIDDIVNRLVECYRPEKVILYGSCSKSGIPEKGSDVDLLVVKDTTRRLIDRLIEVEGIQRRKGFCRMASHFVRTQKGQLRLLENWLTIFPVLKKRSNLTYTYRNFKPVARPSRLRGRKSPNA